MVTVLVLFDNLNMELYRPLLSEFQGIRLEIQQDLHQARLVCVNHRTDPCLLDDLPFLRFSAHDSFVVGLQEHAYALGLLLLDSYNLVDTVSAVELGDILSELARFELCEVE